MSSVPLALLGRPLRKKNRGLNRDVVPAPVAVAAPTPIVEVPEPIVEVPEPIVEVPEPIVIDAGPVTVTIAPGEDTELGTEDDEVDIIGLSMANSKTELIEAAVTLGHEVEGLTKRQILELIG